mgnify:CR=1 FL=1
MDSNSSQAPLFDDAERADVGKCYAKKGRDEAMRLGLAKLRKKLIDNSQEGKQPLPLLGDRETGDFVLGYAQLTLMPVNKSKREAGVGAHSDKPAYGDVIITVGIAGQADVVLTKEAKSVIGSSTVVPILRRRTIKAAMAYCLYGQSRCTPTLQR